MLEKGPRQHTDVLMRQQMLAICIQERLEDVPLTFAPHCNDVLETSVHHKMVSLSNKKIFSKKCIMGVN